MKIGKHLHEVIENLTIAMHISGEVGGCKNMGRESIFLQMFLTNLIPTYTNTSTISTKPSYIHLVPLYALDPRGLRLLCRNPLSDNMDRIDRNLQQYKHVEKS